MTNDPKQKPDLHEEALDSISKKVDEKLAQIMSGSYDDEMERKLAEIQQLRRQEKEALAQEKQGKQDKRGGKRRRHAAPQTTEQEQKPEQKPEPEPEPKPEPVHKAEEKKCAPITIAEIAAQAVAEAAARHALEPEQPPAKPRASQKAERRAERKAQKSQAAAAEEPEGKAELSEDERVALAVDRFFDTAEQIQEEEKKETSQKPDQSMRRLFLALKMAFRKVFRVGKELHGTRKDMEGQSHLTYEKKVAQYNAVWSKHLAPVSRKLEAARDWMLLRAAQFGGWAAKRRADLAVALQLLGARLRSWMVRAYKKSLIGLEYAERHKMRMFACFVGLAVCAGAIAMAVSSMTAYEYSYNGRVLGIVRDQEVVYKTIDVIGGKLAQSLDADIEIDKEKDIAFTKIYGLKLDIDSKDDVLNSLTYMRTLKAKGYAIMADGRQLAILQSRKAAQNILESIKERFSPAEEGVEYESTDFAQDVKIQEVDTNLGNIQNTDVVMEYLLTGAVEKKVHVIEKGQTFNAIAKSYNMKPSELLASNPGLDPDKLKIGQELILTKDSPMLTVQTKEVAVYEASIPFETVSEETSSKYKGEKTVKQKGVNGVQEVKAEIIRNNGVEVGRTILESKILSNPVKQIVQVGTKEKPKTAATGKFAYPVSGARLSSKYGSRWGRTHQGIDLAISKGTPIYASDGGTVSFSGYKGSYGYLVIINHGNGMETYYAHCSKLLVKRGEKVYKGQNIAKVGNTGNSTGPHCHFEIHVNGVSKNPLNYL